MRRLPSIGMPSGMRLKAAEVERRKGRGRWEVGEREGIKARRTIEVRPPPNRPHHTAAHCHKPRHKRWHKVGSVAWEQEEEEEQQQHEQQQHEQQQHEQQQPLPQTSATTCPRIIGEGGQHDVIDGREEVAHTVARRVCSKQAANRSTGKNHSGKCRNVGVL